MNEQGHVPMYPEHEKLQAVQEQSQAVGEFVEWLQHERGWTICEEIPDRNIGFRHTPASFNVQDLLAKFFEIDTAKLEAEKRAMLAVIRGRNGALS